MDGFVRCEWRTGPAQGWAPRLGIEIRRTRPADPEDLRGPGRQTDSDAGRVRQSTMELRPSWQHHRGHLFRSEERARSLQGVLLRLAIVLRRTRQRNRDHVSWG